MNKIYRNKQWLEFREEIIELDGGTCTRCKRTLNEGAILQVHHKKYVKGKALWDYPPESCETLCKGCHAAEHGLIRPNTGWDCIGDDDLGDLIGTCEKCGTSIRYVFFVQHPSWELMSVGTICCDDLTGTTIASERRKYEERLNRFLKNEKWTNEGNTYLIKLKKFDIKIYEVDGRYKVSINNTNGKKTYTAVNDAKIKTFEFIDSGKAAEFFKNRK